MASKNILDRILAALFTKKASLRSLLKTSRMRSASGASGLPRLKRFLTGAALTAALLVGANANADDIYWNVETGKWEVAANWRAGVIPGSGDYAYIDNGGTAFVDTEVDRVSEIYVGYDGSGVLNLSGDGKVPFGDYIYLGYNANGYGTVNVSGIGSALERARLDTYLVVGDSGSGVLNLSDGGKATSGSHICLGANDTGSGMVNVTGNGSVLKTTNGVLYIGEYGSGVLNLSGGGKATTISVISVGVETGANGTVNVSGTGSELLADGPHYAPGAAVNHSIGRSGNGVLNLSDGGKATFTSSGMFNVHIGYLDTGSGKVNVSGARSNLTVDAALNVGNYGSGVLNLTGGGKATAYSTIFIGRDDTGSGTINVSGNGSVLENKYNYLYVGDSGSGVLNLSDGGKATSRSNISLGRNEKSSGTLNVSGTGSVLQNANSVLEIGRSGGGVLNLSDGGSAVSASHINIGVNSTSDSRSDGKVLVGSGSTLESGGNIVVGGYYSNTTSQAVKGGDGLLAGSGTVKMTGSNNAISVFDTVSPGDRPGQTGTLTFTGGKLDFLSGSRLKIDYYHSNYGSRHDLIVADRVDFRTGATIDLSFLHNGYCDIVKANTINISGTDSALPTVTLGGETIGSNTRAAATTVEFAKYDTNWLRMTIANTSPNYVMTWASSNGTGNWNITGQNWTAPGQTRFLDGDAVIFKDIDRSPGSNTVRVRNAADQAYGVLNKTVADMTIEGTQNWTFHGDITANAALTRLGNRTGKLVLGDTDTFTGTATFTGDNWFDGGVDIQSGTMIVSSAANLGTDLNRLKFPTTTNGILQVTEGSDLLFFDGGTRTQRLIVASGESGTIQLEKDASFTVQNNSGANQWGTALDVAGTLVLETADGAEFRFTGNSGSRGGALRSRGTLTLGDAVFSHNNANAAGSTNNDNAQDNIGGAVYMDYGTLNLNGDVEFSFNKAYRQGGAINLYRGTITDNATGSVLFDHNTAQHGGAIYLDSLDGRAKTLSLTGAVFTHNTAAVDPDAPTYTGDAALYGVRGGAMYVANGTVNLTDVEFSYNSAVSAQAGSANGAYGGALYVTGGSVTLNGADFTGNSVTATNTTYPFGYVYGGALYISGGDVTFTGDTRFDSNKATSSSSGNYNEGGAIYYTGGTLEFTGDTLFTDNHADDGGGGGAIRAADLDLRTSTGKLTFTGNTAGDGGAINASSVSLGSGATFTGNTAGGYGGAIVSSSVSLGSGATFTANTAGEGGAIFASSSVSLGSGATFTANTAGGYGGAIYAESVSLGSGATFTANTAGGYGGAIYARSSVSLGSGATFTDNTAGWGGGAIYARSDHSSSVSLGSGATFTGNTADGGGGAIYVFSSSSLFSSSVSLAGNSFFKDNLASGDGGVVFVYGDIGNSVTLDTSAGAIAFSGNKSGVTFVNGKPVSGTGTANSIHMVWNTQLKLEGGNDIYFDDPISSENVTFGNTLTKSGDGFVQFVGDSYLNRTASHTDAGGSVAVTGGTFRVVDGASFTAYGAHAVFTTDTGTTLAGGGTITAQQGFAISGTISPDADQFEIPNYDYVNHEFAAGRTAIDNAKRIGTLNLVGATTFSNATLAVDLASTSSFDKIAVTGTATYNGTTTIDLQNFLEGIYNGLVTSTGTMGALAAYDVTLNGAILNGRQSAAAAVVSGKNLNLTLLDGINVYLTWDRPQNDGIGYWYSGTAANWSDSTGTVTTFQHGDSVAFEKNETRTITLTRGDVNTTGMKVTDGNWIFTTNTTNGRILSTDQYVGDKITPTQKMEISGGNVTLNLATVFANGYEITGGTLTVGTGGSLTGSVVNNAALTFNHTDAKTYGGNISGSGNFTKSGTGVLTLSGTNSYTGATTVSAGTLRINSDARIGSGTNTLSGGTLELTGNTAFSKNWVLAGTGPRTISNANDTQMLGVLSGTGGLNKTDAGDLELTNTNTYTGNTAVSGGTLTVSGLGGLGGGNYAGSITLATGSSIVFAQNSAQTLSGPVSGGGTFTKSGAGILTLSGTNTYTGKTTISGGTLLVTGMLGSTPIENNAALVFDQTANQTLSSALSGTGTLTKQGTGTLTLSGNNTYTGATTLTGGGITLGRAQTFYDFNSTAGTTLTVGGNAATLFGSGTISGAVTGTGTLNIGTGAAVVFDTAVKSFTGTTNLGTGSTLATNVTGQNLTLTGTGTVDADGNTVNLVGTSTFGGTLTGGTYTKTGAGTTTTLSNANMNAGASNFNVDSGTLALTGNMTTTGDVTVANGASLGTAVNEMATATLTANTLTVDGTGMINVTGFSGGQSSETYLLVQTSVDMGNEALSAVRIGDGGADTDNYLTGTAAWGNVGTDQKQLVATVGLSWYNSDFAKAHGNFDIGTGDVAPISTVLEDRSSIISGWDGETLTKKGKGTLILSGTNTYTGGTTIEAGTVSITNAGGVGTGTVTFDAAGDADTKFLDLDFAADGIFVNAITGPGTVTKSGATTVTLTGTNDYTRETRIDAGRLKIASQANIGSGNVVVANGAFFEVETDLPVTLDHKITGGGTLLKSGADTLILTSTTSDYNGGTDIVAGTLELRDVNAAGTGSVDMAAGTDLILVFNDVFSNEITGTGKVTIDGDIVFNRHNISHTGEVAIRFGQTLALSPQTVADEWNYENTIIGDGNLAKTGDGRLILAGTNTYTGETTVAAGILTLTHAASAGSETGGDVKIDDGAVLELDFTADGTFAKNIVDGTAPLHTGKLVKSGDHRVVLSGNNTFSGATEINTGTLAVTQPAALAGTSEVSVVSAAAFELAFTANGMIDRKITGDGKVVKSGDPTVLLSSGTSDYAGGTEISAGGLALMHVNAAGTGMIAIASTASLQLGDSGILEGGPVFGNDFSGAGNLVIDADVTLDRIRSLYDGTITVNASRTLTFDIASDALLANDVTGNGRIVKAGSGSLTLSGTNSHAGATVTAGTLIGTTASLVGNIENNATLVFDQATDGTWSGDLSGSAATAELIKRDSGTVMLSGDGNTYAGTTTIESGKLILGSAVAVGGGDVTVESGSSLQLGSSGTFTGGPGFANELTGDGELVIDAAVTLDRAHAAHSGDIAVNATRTLTLDYVTSDGVLANKFTGSGNVTKTGSRKLTLSGENENTALFTQEGGDMRLDSNWAGNFTQENTAGTFTAAAGTTISGTTNFAGTVELEGTLNTGDLVFNDAAVTDFNIDPNNAANGDLFVSSGNVSFNGANRLDVAFAGGPRIGLYDIISVTGNGSIDAPGGWTYSLGSSYLDGYNLDARGSGIVRSGDAKKLQLLVALDNIPLTWNGTVTADGDVWTNDPAVDTLGNWTNNQAAPLLETKFRNGDSVTFDDSSMQRNVNVVSAVNVGSMTVDGASTYTFTGTGGVTGTNNFSVTGNSTVILANSAANAFGGGTSIGSGSTLQLGNDDATGSLGGAIANDGTLHLKRNDNWTLSNGISGTGTVKQDGTGTVTIGGATQANHFVQEKGVVLLRGDWAGTYTQNEGVLGGAGTITGDSIFAGTVAPGDITTTETLEIVGTADFTGAKLDMNVADGNVADKITVSGTATLGNGATKTTLDILDFRAGEYTFLTASDFGGISIGEDTFITKVGGSDPSARQFISYAVSTNTVKVTLDAGDNAVLVWNGIGGGFREPDQWLSGAESETFIDGDAVMFDDSVVTPQSINLGTGTNTVAWMDVDGGDFIFIGAGEIYGANNPARTTLADPSGKLTVGGNASVTFVNAGTNAFDGGVEIETGSEVTLGNGGGTGSLSGAIVNHGRFILNRNDAVTLDNAISGGGTIVMDGTGTVTISGTTAKMNNFVQNIGTVNLPTEWIGDFDQIGGTLTGSGTVSGTAAIRSVITPTGTLTLKNAVFYGGSTLAIGTLGTDLISVTNTSDFRVATDMIDVDLGTWTLNSSGAVILSNAGNVVIGDTFNAVTLNGVVLSGRRNAELAIDSGDLVLKTTASNQLRTWTGSDGPSWDKSTTQSWQEDDRMFIDGDKVVFGLAGNLVPIVQVEENVIASEMTIDSDTNYTFSGASITTDAASWSGADTASGKLVKNGNGTTTFNNVNDFKSGIDLNAGRINIGNDNAIGTRILDMAAGTTLGFTGNHAISNDVKLSGNVAIDTGNHTATISGVIDGDFALEKRSPGVLILTGENTYAGATTIAAGTLQIGTGMTGSLVSGINIGTGARLVFDRTNDSEYFGELTGTGGVTKNGSGTLTLSGDSSNFDGTFTQSTGNIHLTATLGGIFTQNAGTAFTSTDGATLNTATFKGTVTPTGTLNIAGNATFDNAEVHFGLLKDRNKIIVGGHAAITSASANINAAGATAGSYTLIESDLLTTSGINAFVTSGLDGNRGDVYVNDENTALMFDLIVGHTMLYWNGSDGKNIWNGDDVNRNWTTGNIDTHFVDGDDVTFGDGATNKNVTVAATGVTVSTMTVNDSYNFTGGTITATGDVSVAAEKSFGLHLTGDTPMLDAASLTFGNAAKLNVTGYTPGTTSNYTQAFDRTIVVKTTGGITGFDSIDITVAAQAEAGFLSASAFLDGNNITVETRLAWYGTDPLRKAHGDFDISEGNIFTLGAVLSNTATNLDSAGPAIP